jgi:hypothetical protein
VTDDLRPWTILMLSAGALFMGGLAWYAWERVLCLISAVAYAPSSQVAPHESTSGRRERHDP